MEQLTITEKSDICKAFLEYVTMFPTNDALGIGAEMKIEYSRKMDLIKKVHLNKDGSSRALTPPKTEGGLWYTNLPNGKKLRATSKEKLIDKLIDFYAFPSSEKIANLFNLAIEEKGKLKTANTVKKYKCDYKRFITSKFANMDVTNINVKWLKSYTIDLLRSQTMTTKAFRSYVGLLNLIFNYAIEEDLITFNPASLLKISDYTNLLNNLVKTAENKAMAPETVKELTDIVNRRIASYEARNERYIDGYMFLMSTLTGMRAGELCALKWTDIENSRIHIHAQQLRDEQSGNYYEVPWTKDDKMHTGIGRTISCYDELSNLIDRLRAQAPEGSEYVFCHDNGDPIRKDQQYGKFLKRLCESVNSPVTNNHAIRMYFNSYVLIPAGVTDADRAAWLGHSVRTNLEHYTFPDLSYSDNIAMKLNLKKSTENVQVSKGDPRKIIIFGKGKTPESA